MRMDQAFPSSYLRAGDLPEGTPVAVVIDTVHMEQIGDDSKPVVYFRDKKKGLVLNKTNSNAIAVQYGQESDGWAGNEVTLFATQTEFKGAIVPCIRIKPQPIDPGIGNRAAANVPAEEIPF